MTKPTAWVRGLRRVLPTAPSLHRVCQSVVHNCSSFIAIFVCVCFTFYSDFSFWDQFLLLYSLELRLQLLSVHALHKCCKNA